MKDVLGDALSAYFQKKFKGKLWVNNKYGPREEMPVDVYFRKAEDMPELEWVALQQCRGKVLDIGAGAGSHALVLQQMGLDITALDISPQAAAVMKSRGVKKILCQDFLTLEGTVRGPGDSGLPDPALPDEGSAGPTSFDTLLLLMNGIGLAGTLDGLRKFLAKARRLLLPGGQLIFDSSDIAYLYDGKIPDMPDYYGEILYQYEYQRQQSDWFKWLFIDRKTLREIALSEGWHTELLFGDEWDQYLVRCRPL
ncbi:MAG: methyltransferase domain-containing protein [Bacteroidota bacterium]